MNNLSIEHISCSKGMCSIIICSICHLSNCPVVENNIVQKVLVQLINCWIVKLVKKGLFYTYLANWLIGQLVLFNWPLLLFSWRATEFTIYDLTTLILTHIYCPARIACGSFLALQCRSRRCPEGSMWSDSWATPWNCTVRRVWQSPTVKKKKMYSKVFWIWSSFWSCFIPLPFASWTPCRWQTCGKCLHPWARI